MEDENQYDAVFLIYGDFCPLGPEKRHKLLQNIYRALQPHGKFVLDVSTPECHKKHGNKNGWRALPSGFWKPGPHVVLEEGFNYSEQSIWLDQYTVIEADGKVSVYRNWFQDYTPESITAKLVQNGFTVESMDVLEDWFSSLSERVAPFRIELERVYYNKWGDYAIIGFEVYETPTLRALHEQINRELQDVMLDPSAPHDGDEYRFHLTIELGQVGGSNPFKRYMTPCQRKM